MSTCFGSLHSGHVHKRRSSFTETQKSSDFMTTYFHLNSLEKFYTGLQEHSINIHKRRNLS